MEGGRHGRVSGHGLNVELGRSARPHLFALLVRCVEDFFIPNMKMLFLVSISTTFFVRGFHLVAKKGLCMTFVLFSLSHHKLTH